MQYFLLLIVLALLPEIFRFCVYGVGCVVVLIREFCQNFHTVVSNLLK